jgi:hypothetical protein
MSSARRLDVVCGERVVGMRERSCVVFEDCVVS